MSQAEPNIKGITADNENINWNKIGKLYGGTANSLQNSKNYKILVFLVFILRKVSAANKFNKFTKLQKIK